MRTVRRVPAEERRRQRGSCRALNVISKSLRSGLHTRSQCSIASETKQIWTHPAFDNRLENDSQPKHEF